MLSFVVVWILELDLWSGWAMNLNPKPCQGHEFENI
jgi:hypothetical protein